MNEKVAKLAIVRERRAGYFVKDGIVWRVHWAADRPELGKVHDLGLSQDRRFFYFVDDGGDVSRVLRGKGGLAEVEAMAEGVARCMTNRFLGECCKDRNLKPSGKNRDLAARLLTAVPGAKGLREIFKQLKMEDLRERTTEIGVSGRGRKEEFVEALVEAVLSGQAAAVATAWNIAVDSEGRERDLQYERHGDPEERKPEDVGDGERYELSWPEEQQIEARISEAEKYPLEEMHGTAHAKLLAIDSEAARSTGGTTRLAEALGTLFDDAELCGLSLTSFRFCLEFARLSGLVRLIESKRIDSKDLRFLFLPPDGCDLDSAFWLRRKMRQGKLTVREFPDIGGRRMHVKLLLARFRHGTEVAIVGSSNATRAGIVSNEEFNVAFTCDGSRPSEPQRWFENAWQAGAPFDPHHFNFDLPPPRVRRPLFLFQCRAVRMLKERLGPLLDEAPRAGNRNSLGGYGGGLLVMPTGAGKTLTAMRWIVEDVLPRAGRRRVLWLTHRRELLEQAADTANQEIAVAKYPGLEMNYLGGTELGIDVDDVKLGDLVFMTVSRAHAFAGRSGGKSLPKFDLVVIDEAHRASTSGVQYREVLTAIPHSARLGLTATPYRGQAGDYSNFAEVFRKPEDKDEKATFLAQHTVEEIEQEPLPGGAKLFAKLEPVQIKTDFKLRINARDEIEFAQKLRLFDAEPRNSIIVETWLKHARGHGPSIIFCVSHEHANTIAATINDRNGRAQAFHQCETTPEATKFAPLAGQIMNSHERGRILERFGNGEIEVLCCVQLLTEGFDLPGIGAILLARPTMSTLLLMQMIGRGRRGPAVGGLPQVKVVDFADQVEIHTDRHDTERRQVVRFEDAERAWRSRTVSGEDAREGE